MKLPTNLNAIVQSFPTYEALRKDYAAHGYLGECYEEIIQKLREYDADIERDLQRLVNRVRAKSAISIELNQLDKAYAPKVVSRVKSLESVYRKLCDGTIRWEDLPLDDTVGYRVVCRFADECLELRDLIDNELQQAPFTLQSRFPRDEKGNWVEKVPDSGYRSCDFAFVYARPEIGLVLEGELQLRTALQHVWAEVSHDTLYKNADLSKAPSYIAGGANAMMHALSDNLNAVDRHLVEVRRLVIKGTGKDAKGEDF
ncbi:RelA/SpoT domain-containing protein [Candidatus Woesearchaeota archaeon]|nr:RelA/SpoT domain-containing protein [Candidatus Woesearchaeota archaeon]